MVFWGFYFSVWFGYDSFLGFGWLWVFVVAAKKKGTWKKRLVSIPGFLPGEEKLRKGSWPKRAITFLSPPLFPPLLCKLPSWMVQEWVSGEQGQARLYTPKSHLDSFASSRGEYKIYWRMTYCGLYRPVVSRQLGLLVPMNGLKIYWPFPGNLLENLCGQTIVLATVQDTKGLFWYNERFCWNTAT